MKLLAILGWLNPMELVAALVAVVLGLFGVKQVVGRRRAENAKTQLENSIVQSQKQGEQEVRSANQARADAAREQLVNPDRLRDDDGFKRKP